MKRSGLLLSLLLLCLATASARVHPGAFSHLRLTFAADEVLLDFRVQELTLRELQSLQLDQDGSGHISTAEMEDQWNAVASLFESHLWLNFDGEVIYPSFSIAGYDGDLHQHDDDTVDFQYLLCTATVDRPDTLEQVTVHSDLFLNDGNPNHIMSLEATGFGEGERHYLLKGEDHDWRLDLPQPSTQLGRYTVLGWEHVLIGWDHLAFLVALLFGVRNWRSLLGAVTAFTAAHSLTLAVSALGLLSLPPHWVEPGIALSVLFVLAWHLRLAPEQQRPWLPALLFGLVHGFGFAGVLGDIGLPNDARAMALIGFNLGVELGQLCFVTPVILLAVILRKRLGAVRATAWRWAVAMPIAAAAVFLVGTTLLRYAWPSLTGHPATLVAWLLGSACMVLTIWTPGGDFERQQKWKRAGLQACLLCAFFMLGQSLRA